MGSSTSDASHRQKRPMKDDGLECQVRTPEQLAAVDRQQMYRLMMEYYENVDHSDFERDLAEKEWAILMQDSAGSILGFTTLMRLRAQCEGEQLVALFSGDTVLAPEIWGAGGWVRAWGHLAAKLMQEMSPVPLYWLLLTATHRTYRFLPALFKEYYPRPERATPRIHQCRMEALVREKFTTEYDPARGTVQTQRPMAVRQESMDLATQGISERHAAFFAELNPDYLRGDYLVCITDLSPSNQTRLGKRIFTLSEA